MLNEYQIAETFEITGRGAVVVLDEVSERSVAKPYSAVILRPDGVELRTTVFKEWLLRREPTLVEREAYLLKGLHKDDIPIGSRLRFLR